MPARSLLVAAVALVGVVGCSPAPPAAPTAASTPASSPAVARPTQPEPPADPDAWKKVASGPITAEVVSVEVRPVKTAEALTRAEKAGPESLIIRVRFSNSDDTFNATGAVFTDSGATDDFGNTTKAPRVTAFEKIAEPNEYTDLTPKSPAVWSFVFEKPIPKATRVKVTITGHFDRAATKRLDFPFVVPLSPAK